MRIQVWMCEKGSSLQANYEVIELSYYASVLGLYHKLYCKKLRRIYIYSEVGVHAVVADVMIFYEILQQISDNWYVQ